jgi:hypothetical protein
MAYAQLLDKSAFGEYNPNMRQAKHEAEQPREQDARAPAKRVWVGVRVSQSFHQRIQTESARRDRSIQELLMDAMKWYFKTAGKGLTPVQIIFEDSRLTTEEVAERDAWSGLWDRYIGIMPREKIQVLAAAMQWDLRTLKSSRRKPSAWKRLDQEQGG